jgi:hypothetical protein
VCPCVGTRYGSGAVFVFKIADRHRSRCRERGWPQTDGPFGVEGRRCASGADGSVPSGQPRVRDLQSANARGGQGIAIRGYDAAGVRPDAARCVQCRLLQAEVMRATGAHGAKSQSHYNRGGSYHAQAGVMPNAISRTSMLSSQQVNQPNCTKNCVYHLSLLCAG